MKYTHFEVYASHNTNLLYCVFKALLWSKLIYNHTMHIYMHVHGVVFVLFLLNHDKRLVWLIVLSCFYEDVQYNMLLRHRRMDIQLFTTEIKIDDRNWCQSDTFTVGLFVWSCIVYNIVNTGVLAFRYFS